MNIVEFPKLANNIGEMLRLLADEIEAGEFGPDPIVVCAINGDEFQVRGFGNGADSRACIATLQMASTSLAIGALDSFDD